MTFGAKVSQDGYDVLTAADYQLLYSSEWPLLKVAYQGSFSFDAGQDFVIRTHNLMDSGGNRYVPWYWVFLTNGYHDSDLNGKSRLISLGASQFLQMDDTRLKWWGLTNGAPGGTIEGYYYIFYEKMVDTFTAAIFNTTGESKDVGAPTYGIKIAKPGADVSSTDFRDFVLRSDCRSPMIHAKRNGSLGSGGGTVNLTHNLQYEPMFFAAAKLAGQHGYQLLTNGDDAYANATSTDFGFGLPYQCDYAYMLFKDPILLN